MAPFPSTDVTVAVLLLLLSPSVRTQTTYAVDIDLINSDYTVDLKFLSVAVGTRTLIRTEGSNPQMKVDNTRFQNLAKGIAPASVRLGGSYANFFIFNPDGRSDPVPASVVSQWESTFGVNFTNGEISKWKNAEFSGVQWERVVNFTKAVEWDLLADINQFLRNGNEWDPSNFKLLLDYCRDNGIQVFGFQLGNEPNSYGYKFQGAYHKNGTESAADYAKFREVLRSYPDFNDTMIIGPDPTSLARSGSARTFLNEFLAAGAGNSVSAIGLHHYFFSGPDATLADFKDPEMFDQIKYLAQNATQMRDQYAPGVPIYLTETASAYSGGSTMSKTFISTLIYLDELGQAAKYGISRVHRQTFNSANYAMVDSDSVQPHPDYYLAVLFKRLIQGPVLNVDCPTCNAGLRVYASCARREPYSLFRTSSVFYYVNANDDSAIIDFTIDKYTGREMKVFILESADSTNLASPNMTLNGNLLEMNGDVLPDMPPVTMYGPTVTVPGNSVGFIATQEGRGTICKAYYIEFDANRNG